MFANPDPFEGYTVTLFVIFVFVMTIIMMNLITGLALDDIQKIAENAEFQNLSMQVDMFKYPYTGCPTKLYCIRWSLCLV